MNEQQEQQMRENFADMVRAAEKYAHPWRVATGVMAMITVLCLVKIILM